LLFRLPGRVLAHRRFTSSAVLLPRLGTRTRTRLRTGFRARATLPGRGRVRLPWFRTGLGREVRWLRSWSRRCRTVARIRTGFGGFLPLGRTLRAGFRTPGFGTAGLATGRSRFGRAIRVPQASRDRGLHGRRRGLHVLALRRERVQYFLACGAELLRELVHVGLACHCSP